MTHLQRVPPKDFLPSLRGVCGLARGHLRRRKEALSRKEVNPLLRVRSAASKKDMPTVSLGTHLARNGQPKSRGEYWQKDPLIAPLLPLRRHSSGKNEGLPNGKLGVHAK